MNSPQDDIFLQELIHDINNNDSNTQTNIDNTQQNHNLENNKYIGTEIDHRKADGVFRVIGGNPNGIKITEKGGELAEYLEEAKRMSADTVMMYEINLDTQKPKVKQVIHSTCNNLYDHHSITYASSATPSKNQFKPGGTVLCVTENSSGRVTAKGSDDMGRWTYQTLTCKGDKSLTMISAYQVCKQQLVNNSRVSTLTATAQQISALRQQGRDILPRKAFTQDLESFIAHEHGKGNGILFVCCGVQ